MRAQMRVLDTQSEPKIMGAVYFPSPHTVPPMHAYAMCVHAHSSHTHGMPEGIRLLASILSHSPAEETLHSLWVNPPPTWRTGLYLAPRLPQLLARGQREESAKESREWEHGEAGTRAGVRIISIIISNYT